MNEKRRFVDRLTMSIDSLHLNRVYKYDKLFRQRNKILAQPNSDEKWLDTIESQISELSVSIISNLAPGFNLKPTDRLNIVYQKTVS